MAFLYTSHYEGISEQFQQLFTLEPLYQSPFPHRDISGALRFSRRRLISLDG